MQLLTLTLFDAPQGDVKPNPVTVVTINTDHIISAMYIITQNEYIITLTGTEIYGDGGPKWMKRSKVDKDGNIKPVEGQHDLHQASNIKGTPIFVSVTDDEQIRKVWDFLNPGEECPLFALHQAHKDKIQSAKDEIAENQEAIKAVMQDTGMYDTAQNPIVADKTTGKIVGMDGVTPLMHDGE